MTDHPRRATLSPLRFGVSNAARRWSGTTREGGTMPMWGGPWGGQWYGFWWLMPIFWVLVIAVVIAVVLRNTGGRASDVSQDLAAMRRDIQELKEEVRKLREEGKGAGDTRG